jgi:L-fuculose-phosphate aldolase
MSELMSGGRDEELRRSIVIGCRELASLTPGTSGNVSTRRDANGFFVSPTGMSYRALEASDIPLVTFDGHWYGRRRPSSEWRFHRDILASRSEIGAIVHTHSPQATALACAGRAIPAFHYMVAAAGGADIRCAPYHIFGSQALSDAALKALEGRRACLLAQHGVIALGVDVAAALVLATEVEDLAMTYCAALALGNLEILSAEEMGRVVEKFRTYGRQDVPEPDLEFRGEVPPAAVDRP